MVCRESLEVLVLWDLGDDVEDRWLGDGTLVRRARIALNM